MTFIKIKENDTVYDREKKMAGIVINVDTNKNVATVLRDEGGLFEANLFNLTVVEDMLSENEPEEEDEEQLKIQIKYFNKDIAKIEKISKGDWIDLRAAETVELKAGEYKMVKLGVGMKLPEGYEANIVPRSSTFKNYGIIQTNHYAVIDSSYSGNDDQYHFPVYATRDTVINFNDRICQFRIQEVMKPLVFEEVENLDEVSRGGFGSSGVK